MDISKIITMVTDFFSSIPWQNVVQSFVDSVSGIDWDSLKSLFDGFDLSGDGIQAIIDGFVATIKALFSTLA